MSTKDILDKIPAGKIRFQHLGACFQEIRTRFIKPSGNIKAAHVTTVTFRTTEATAEEIEHDKKLCIILWVDRADYEAACKAQRNTP